MQNIDKDYNELKYYIYEICDKLNIDKNKIKIILRNNNEKIQPLTNNQMAIYTYKYKNKYLKIGKSYSKSNSRFKYQHYSINSSNSNLAKRIYNDIEFCNENNIDKNDINKWIINNLIRIDIIMDKDLNIFTLNLFEACLHYKYEPKYEGYKSQR